MFLNKDGHTTSVLTNLTDCRVLPDLANGAIDARNRDAQCASNEKRSKDEKRLATHGVSHVFQDIKNE